MTEQSQRRPAPRGRVSFLCANCGQPEERPRSAVKDPSYAFCSKECFYQRGPTPLHKRGGRPRDDHWEEWSGSPHPEINDAVLKYGPPESELEDGKYLYYMWPRHPASTSNKRAYAHRVVAYEHVGEGIRNHHVDHINNNGLDNRWENLRVLTPSEHGKKTASRDRAPAGFWEWAKSQKDILDRWEASDGT